MWGADLAKKARIRAATNVYPDGLPAAVQQQLARRYADGASITHSSGIATDTRSRPSRRWSRCSGRRPRGEGRATAADPVAAAVA
jgi:hypothetical protein